MHLYFELGFMLSVRLISVISSKSFILVLSIFLCLSAEARKVYELNVLLILNLPANLCGVSKNKKGQPDFNSEIELPLLHYLRKGPEILFPTEFYIRTRLWEYSNECILLPADPVLYRILILPCKGLLKSPFVKEL